MTDKNELIQTDRTDRTDTTDRLTLREKLAKRFHIEPSGAEALSAGVFLLFARLNQTGFGAHTEFIAKPAIPSHERKSPHDLMASKSPDRIASVDRRSKHQRIGMNYWVG